MRNRYLYLRECSPTHGWGVYAIDTMQPEGLCVEVPRPLAEWGTVESGLCLFRNFPSQGLAIAGALPKNDISGNADVLKSRDSMFAVFHTVFGHSNVLQVRGYTKASFRQLERVKRELTLKQRILKPRVTALDQGCDPVSAEPEKTQRSDWQDTRSQWNDSPIPNQLRQKTYGNFAELFLNHRDRRRLIGHLLVPVADAEGTAVSDEGSPYQVGVRAAKPAGLDG